MKGILFSALAKGRDFPPQPAHEAHKIHMRYHGTYVRVLYVGDLHVQIRMLGQDHDQKREFGTLLPWNHGPRLEASWDGTHTLS